MSNGAEYGPPSPKGLQQMQHLPIACCTTLTGPGFGFQAVFSPFCEICKRMVFFGGKNHHILEITKL